MSYLHRLDRWLAPTEGVSTGLLWVVAIVAILVAVWGSPTTKAAVAGWMVLP
jgi:hypothetical protein